MKHQQTVQITDKEDFENAAWLAAGSAKDLVNDIQHLESQTVKFEGFGQTMEMGVEVNVKIEMTMERRE